MKKIAKIFGAIAAIGAAVAGGVALYKKFISPNEDFEDPDDELDEEFEDEDLDMDTSKTTDRSYVSLTPAEEPKEEAPAEETAEEATEKEALLKRLHPLKNQRKRLPRKRSRLSNPV